MAKASKEKGKTPLVSWMMPRDVAMRWNSTYEMLDFAYTYHEAYNEVTGNRDMNMQEYELSRQEWKIVKDLVAVLRVSEPNIALILSH